MSNSKDKVLNILESGFDNSGSIDYQAKKAEYRTVYKKKGPFQHLVDPYYGWEEGVTYEQMIEQINKILELKREHPNNVVLLSGNHDLQYWIGEGDTNRYDWRNNEKIGKLFKDNAELFDGMAYHVGEKYLITHAGVTFDWYTINCDKNFVAGNVSLEEICQKINDLWNSGQEGKYKFTFRNCVTKFSDYYGDSCTHSPAWIRPESLWENNLFGWTSGFIQVVGHTPFNTYKNDDWIGKIGTYCTEKNRATVEELEKGRDYYLLDGLDTCRLTLNSEKDPVEIIFVDCLREETACVEIDDQTMEWKKIEVK